MNLKKLFKTLLSLLMVCVMLVGVASPVISAAGYIEHLHKDVAGDGKLHYVSLGASNTNGYGHHGYLDPEIYEDPLAAPKANMNDYGYDKAPANAYPALIRDALAEKTGREVELHQLAISSMRVEEVLWLLDDTFEPDEYMNWRFTGGKSWFDMAKKEYDTSKYSSSREALRGEYRDYIANADVITVDLGWNNFGVYAFNNIMTILKENGGRYWKAPDFEKVIDADMEEEYYAIRDKVVQRLKDFVDLSETALTDKVIEMLADVLAYAAFGACYNFDKVIEKIYELNPDANVVVINIQNLADELILDLEGTKIPLGDMYGELIEFVDFYRASLSPNSQKYGFAYAGVDGDVDTFLDEFRLWNGDPATLTQDMKDLFDMYDDSLYVRSIIEYGMVGTALSTVFKTIRDMGNLYGLQVFTDDDQYTYEFSEFDESWLADVDLADLNLANPQKPVEKYGAAVSKHLVNIRNFENGGKDAYNYVFDNLVAGLNAQKTTIETQKDNAIAFRDGLVTTKNGLIVQKAKCELQLETETNPGSIEALEKAIAECDQGIKDCNVAIAQYEAGIAQADQGIAQIDNAVQQVIPVAKQGFDQNLYGIYLAYKNTLNYAYDTVGTIVQYTLQYNTFYMSPESMANHNSNTDKLLGYLVSTFQTNAKLKFFAEMGMPQGDVPEIDVNEALFLDPGIQAVCALEVRYDFGNSFFAHPSVKGNQQIRDAVMRVLENGSDADSFADNKVDEYINMFEDVLNSYYEEKYTELQDNGTIGQINGGLDIIDSATGALEEEINNYIIPSDIAIAPERAENIKNLLLEEIDNIQETSKEIRELLALESIEFTAENYQRLVRLNRNLEKHVETLSELLVEIEYVADFYVVELEAVIDYQTSILNGVAEDAYEHLENEVEAFEQRFDELVELVGSYVDRIDSALGEAVRTYLVETPKDAIMIICQYGEDALYKLAVDALALNDSLYSSVSAIVAVMVEHGKEIYDEIVADEEYVALVEAIERKKADLEQLYLEITESPIVAAIDIDKRIEKEVNDLIDLYKQFVDITMKNVEAYDEEVAEILYDALMDFVGELGIIADAGESYANWLGEHSKLMLGAILHSFLENTVELGKVADTVIADYLRKFNIYANELRDELEDSIRELVQAKIDYIKEIYPELKNAALAELMNMMSDSIAFIAQTVYGAFNGQYTTDDDSYFVAITGQDSEYAKLLASALGLSDKHSIMGWDNLDYDILNKADFITIGYDRTQVSGFAVDQFLATVAAYGNESLRAQVAAYLAETLADDFDEEGVAQFSANIDNAILAALEHPAFKDKVVENMDWSRVVGAENVEFINEILCEVEAQLREKGITGDITVSVNIVEVLGEYLPGDAMSIDLFNDNPIFELTIPAADLIMIAVESYIYSNVVFYMDYADTIITLAESNPDVKIAVLGQYNPFNDMEFMGVNIPLAKIYDKIAAVSSVNSLVYALALPNVVYVDISEAETLWNGIDDLPELLIAYLENPKGDMFTDESSLYIMNQILGAYGLTCVHEYDNCEDEICNICGAVNNDAGHKYEAVVTKPDCTNGGYTTYTCKKCGDSYVDKRTDALGHKYDNACDDACNVCGEKRTPAEHVFGEWTIDVEATQDSAGTEKRVCSVCGHTETRSYTLDPLPPEVIPEEPPVEESTFEFGTPQIVAVVFGSAVMTFGVVAAVYAFIQKKRR